MKSSVYNIKILLFCLFSQLISAQDYPGLDAFVQSELVKDAQLSIFAKDLNSADTLAAYNERLYLIPASNLKLFTTALAWKSLKPNFTFKTRFYRTGFISPAGIMDGDILIEGEGDPTMGSDKWRSRDPKNIFDQIVLQLQQLEIDTVKGDVVISTHPWKGEWHNGDWSWSDIGNYYGISSGSLNIYENTYEVTFSTTGNVGELAEIKSISPAVEINFDNQVKIGPPHSGDQAYIFGNAQDNHRLIRGSVPKDGSTFKIKGSLTDPEIYFGKILSQYLRENGIIIQGEVRKDPSNPSGKKELLLIYASPPLSEIVQYINSNSHNLFAEAIYKYGYLKNRIETDKLLREWKKKGIDTEHIRWKDGCGLSPFNRFSAKNFVDLIDIMSGDEGYINTFAMPGKEGTLKYRFSDLGGLKAKTGSIEGVYALSGIITNGQKNIAFSILVNNFYKPSRLMDAEVQKLFSKWLE